MFKTFVTFSFHALAAVEKHLIKINHHHYSEKRAPGELKKAEQKCAALHVANTEWDRQARELYKQYETAKTEGQDAKAACKALQHQICKMNFARYPDDARSIF